METGNQQSQAPGGMNIQVLKEPRGLIRVLQWIFAIFAFSTTAGFWTDVKFSIVDICPSVTTVIIEYPFRIADTIIDCQSFKLVGDMSTQSQYFVAVGVLSFLYCMGILAVYLLFEAIYQSNALIPIIDLGFTGVFAIFWLTASAAWAQGVSDIKYFADPIHFIPDLLCTSNTSNCTILSRGSYATLNVSLIFGFANFALWGASLWFIYKETEWFKKRQADVIDGTPK